MEEMEEAFSNYKVILNCLHYQQPRSLLLFASLDKILSRLTMTRRTFSRLPTLQSPFSSCGPFSTFSHRSTALNEIL